MSYFGETPVFDFKTEKVLQQSAWRLIESFDSFVDNICYNAAQRLCERKRRGRQGEKDRARDTYRGTKRERECVREKRERERERERGRQEGVVSLNLS